MIFLFQICSHYLYKWRSKFCLYFIILSQHRFYGDSIPFGYSKEEVMRNSSIRGYFSSSQAIADYAEVLLHVKEEFSLQNSPIIVIGGSYGGSKNL